MEADLLPARAFLVDLEAVAVRDDLLQCLRMPQAVTADKIERAEGGDHHQAQQPEQDIPLGGMRHRRGGIVSERERRLPGSPFDQGVDQIIEIGPFLDLGVVLFEESGPDVLLWSRLPEHPLSLFIRCDQGLHGERGKGCKTLAHLGRAIPGYFCHQRVVNMQ